ncbi:hypothetical protein FQR65_LT05811 [Abscondita terminalis]|nr:hypothetical protein FQR65_LT05811 [Abscondita terminalis]
MKFSVLFLCFTVALISVMVWEVDSQAVAPLPSCPTSSLDYISNCIIENIRTKITNAKCALSEANKKYIIQRVVNEFFKILGMTPSTCQGLKTLLEGLFMTVNGVFCTLTGILGGILG